jgi:hypothetical protein
VGRVNEKAKRARVGEIGTPNGPARALHE